MANIAFTDAIGAATLTNGKPAPGDRFSSWNPSSPPVGVDEEAVGTGLLHTFTFRDDYLVSFELKQIPRTEQAIMLRLQRHLRKGGLVAVNTQDAANRSYPTCCLVKGTNPEPKLADTKNIEYSMAFMLRNVAAVPADFICIY
ncbi:MAG TPA: hypothetical protein VNO75_12370 [Gemmatimonadaceae bacterium]|nr:hypothetical protein [Gemmatimonadaceae bacterium]